MNRTATPPSPRKRQTIAALSVVLTLVVGACSVSSPSPSSSALAGTHPTVAPGSSSAASGSPCTSPTKVKLALSSSTALSFTPIYVAQHFDFFADECLAVETVTSGAAGTEVVAVLAGDAQFAASGILNAVAAAQQGKKSLWVAALQQHLQANLVISKTAFDKGGLNDSSTIDQRIAALKGLRMSVSRPGSLTDQVLRVYAKRGGLDPAKDMQIIATGYGPPQIAALQQGTVDGFSSTTPQPQIAIAQGLAVTLIDNANGQDPIFNPFAEESIMVEPSYAEANPDVVRAFVRAIVRANRWVKSHPPAESAAIYTAVSPSTSAGQVVDWLPPIISGIPEDGCQAQKAVEADLTLVRDAGIATQTFSWTDFVSNDYLPAGTKC